MDEKYDVEALDEMYLAGLKDAARATCPTCVTKIATEVRPGLWEHGGQACASGKIWDLMNEYVAKYVNNP